MTGNISSHLEFRKAGLEEILDLRRRILRAGMPGVSAEFPGDREPRTLHFAAFDGPAAIGCLTLIPSSHEGKPAWQLRGMAVDSAFQGKGIGHRLLAFARDALAGDPVETWWCNARVSAAGFYGKDGWRIVSEVYEIPPIGPHYKMVWSHSDGRTADGS